MTDHDQIFIGGQWTDSAVTDRIDVINPATEEVIGSIPAGTAGDVDRAVRAAAAAFPAWSRSPVAERAAIMSRAARAVEARADEITRVITSEVGHPYALAKTAQTATSVSDLDIVAETLGEVRWDEQVAGSTIRYEPVGVVAAITPWNSPLHQVCIKIGAAIAAGCTVVLKPSEVAPETAYILTRIFAEAGLPAGVLNLVTGLGPVAGEAMASHPLVDMVSLTGSLRAGRRVMELAAGSVKRVALELGGKSPNLIFADTDLQRAVTDGITDCFRNSGQVCGGLSRMLVPRESMAKAGELAAAAAESFVIGDPFAADTTLGPVTTRDQRDKVRGYIEQGISGGVRMLAGGPGMPDGLERGYFVRPTVFTDVDNQLPIAREEIFGPVIVIEPFGSEEEAVAIANDSPYGLAAGIWTDDADRIDRVVSQLRVGRVRVNGAPLNRRAPHGGFKQSGMGRERGRHGIEEFLAPKSVTR